MAHCPAPRGSASCCPLPGGRREPPEGCDRERLRRPHPPAPAPLRPAAGRTRPGAKPSAAGRGEGGAGVGGGSRRLLWRCVGKALSLQCTSWLRFRSRRDRGQVAWRRAWHTCVELRNRRRPPRRRDEAVMPGRTMFPIPVKSPRDAFSLCEELQL